MSGQIVVMAKGDQNYEADKSKGKVTPMLGQEEGKETPK